MFCTQDRVHASTCGMKKVFCFLNFPSKDGDEFELICLIVVILMGKLLLGADAILETLLGLRT